MNSGFDFDIEFDLSDIEQALGKAQGELRLSTHRGADMASKEAVDEVKARHRYKDRSRKLTDDAFARMLVSSDQGAEAEMVWPAPYASYVDAGTAPHTIRPKLGAGVSGPVQLGQGRRRRGEGRTFLRFLSSSGAVVFARAVRHPGTRATGFAADAYQKAERVLIREAEHGVARAQEILGR